LTLVDVDELLLPYLAEHPPVHILVAGFVGFKPRRRPARDDVAEWRHRLGSGDVHAGMQAPVMLDFAALKARHHG
jgi:hypothetical protein